MKAGERTAVRVTGSLIRGEDTLSQLDIDKMNCKFSFEKEGVDVLANYSTAGCFFECLLKKSRETCNCTPWNYPHPAGCNISSFK